MTINEAIIYAEEMAATDGNRKRQDNYNQIAEWLKDYKRMLQQEPCEDAISRIEALNSLDKVENRDSWYRLTDVMKMIRNLPSVTPQPKTGRWIYEDALYSRCSECGELAIIANWSKVLSDFCPNCGARMVEPQESEE